MNHDRLGACAAGLAALLPVFLLSTDTATGASDLEVMVRLHQHPAFPIRVALTAIYFPAAILSHFVLTWGLEGPSRTWGWFGFLMFLVGNGIDAIYRSVQFAVVHYQWSAQWLASPELQAQRSLAAKIEGFNEVGVGVYVAFAAFFAVGRFTLGAATFMAPGLRFLGVTFLVVGAFNLLPWFGRLFDIPLLANLGAYYLVPWLVNLAALVWSLWFRGSRPSAAL